MTTSKKIFDVNVFGMVRVTRAFLPLIRNGGGGRVINMSSAITKFGLPFNATYAMSKTCVNMFSDCLRREMGAYGVKVACVQPLSFNTQMLSKNQVLPDLEKVWFLTSDEIKAVYGQNTKDFLFKMLDLFGDSTFHKETNLNAVSDVIIDGMTLSEPEHQYLVSNFYNAPFFSLGYCLIPSDVVEFVFKVLNWVFVAFVYFNGQFLNNKASGNAERKTSDAMMKKEKLRQKKDRSKGLAV